MQISDLVRETYFQCFLDFAGEVEIQTDSEFTKENDFRMGQLHFLKEKKLSRSLQSLYIEALFDYCNLQLNLSATICVLNKNHIKVSWQSQ